uniref:Ig-like domain-containing protein n=1 Tax=Catagonus wagneri TaxID=51154 RepID=A0A8C3YKR5_9CETA
MVPLLLLLPLLWGGEWAGYWLQVQESVTVPECLDVNVTCSFSDPWSRWYPAGQLFIYWFREGDDIRSSEPVATNDPRRAVKQETQGRFQLLGDPESNDCSLSIRDARMSDTGVYFFRVERGERSKYKYSYRDKTLKLQVTGLTEKPDIRFQEPLESGRPTNLTCSLPQVCDGGRLVRFSWAGGALDAMDPETLGSSVLTLTPRPQDHGTNLTCQVKLQGSQVTTERTILLNVSYAPWNLAIKVSLRNVTGTHTDTPLRILQNTSSLLIFEGQAPTLRCVADGNPPAQLSWFPESPALKVTPMSSTAILKLSGVGTAPREITCQAQNPLGSRNLSLNLLVLLGPSCSWEDEGLHCSCSSRARPAPSLRWRLGEGLLDGNFSNASVKVTSSSSEPWANSSLRLGEGLSSGLRLSCEAQNIHGAQSATVLLPPGQGRGLGDKDTISDDPFSLVQNEKETEREPTPLVRPPPTRPRQPLISFLSVQSSLFWVFHIRGITKYALLCDTS